MAATPTAMETTPRTDADGRVVDQELQLTPDELALLLETTTPTEDDDDASFYTLPSDDASSSSAQLSCDSNDPLNAKRARRSEIEKLSRRRRQATLRGMRDEVRQLEHKMAELLLAAEHAKEQDTAVVAVAAAPPVQRTDVSVSHELKTLRGRFVQLSLEAQRLEGEKTDLRRMLRSRQLLSQSIQSLADAFIEDWEEGRVQSDMVQFLFEPLPREELFRIMRVSFERIVAYDACKDFVSSSHAFMGWVDRRRVENDGIFFSFTKSFPGRDPERVMLDSWKMFTDQDSIRESAARVQAHVVIHTLQQPNEDVVVVHRTTYSTRMEKIFRTVFILFRLRTDDGYTICFRTIPTPAIQETLQENEIWLDMFQWIHFQHMKDEDSDDSAGCRVLFGGAILDKLPGTIAEFLLNSFHSVVRWETLCLGPLFLLPSDPSQGTCTAELES